MPIVTITDVIQEGDCVVRQKTVALFGFVVYRRSESYPISKDRTVGFNCGNGLTYVEEDD